MFFASAKSGGHWGRAARLSIVATILLLPTNACLESRADEKLLSAKERRLAQAVILSQNCGTCHSLKDGDFELAGKIGPSLSERRGALRDSNWLRTQLTNPQSIPDHQAAPGFAGKQKLMPALQVSDVELEVLIEYLQSLR